MMYLTLPLLLGLGFAAEGPGVVRPRSSPQTNFS